MSKPLRICHLTSVHQDGDVRIFHKMAKTMSSDFEVHTVVPNTKSRIDDGVTIHSFEAETKNRKIRMQKTVNQVLEVAIQVDADIYHLHDPELLRLSSKLKANGAKVIFDSHEDVPKQIMDKHWIPWILRRFISIFYAQYERYYSKKLDGIISVTPTICERFSKINSKVELIRNFPLAHEFPAVNFTLKNPSELCYIGGLYESRGIREVVLAMENIDGHLHLAGSFDDPALQKELEQSMAWQKVTLHGQIKRDEIQKLLKKCAVGIVTLHPTPSYKEAYPIKMFEYMAGGCAILASDFPLYRLLLGDDTCGRFVDPMHVSQIEEALKDFIENPTQTLQYGQNARQLFEKKFNWEEEAKKLRIFYQTL